MRTAFDDPSVFEHHDGVAVADRGQPVGNNEYGPASHEVIHTLLYDLFGPGIDGGCCLVEDQHRRICDRRTRDREQLSLALGEFFSVAA